MLLCVQREIIAYLLQLQKLSLVMLCSAIWPVNLIVHDTGAGEMVHSNFWNAELAERVMALMNVVLRVSGNIG